MCVHVCDFVSCKLLLQSEWSCSAVGRKLADCGAASPEVTGVMLGHPF